MKGSLRRALAWLFPRRQEWYAARRPLGACLLSGLCGGLVFPPVAAGWLAHLALVPMLMALPFLRGSLVFWGTLLFSSVWAYLNLWWLNTLVVFHPAIPVGILLLGVIVGLFAVPFGYGARLVLMRAPGWLVPWGVAAAWAGSEFLRQLGDTAFPWNLLGHSQISGPTAMLAQWAEKGGVTLVSFLVVLSNGMLAQAGLQYLRLKRPPQPLSDLEMNALLSRHPHLDPDPVRLGRDRHQKRIVLAVLDGLWTAVALFFFVITALGLELRTTRHQEYRAGQPGGKQLQVGLVQTNINLLEKMRKYDLERDSRIRSEVGQSLVAEALRLGRDVATASPTLELLVFPEAMFVDPFFVFDIDQQKVVQDFSRSVGMDVLFGSDGWEDRDAYRKRLALGRVVPQPSDPLPTMEFPQLEWEAQDNGTTVGIVPLDRLARFVSAYQVKPVTGLVPRVYHKIQLVPFGEHAPLLDWLPFNLAERLLWVAAFQQGTIITQFETAGVRIGPLICFESTFSTLARQQAQSGAQILAVITNDAWYDPAYARSEGGLIGWLFGLPGFGAMGAPGPDQHLIHSRFRAIETRLPVMRAANRGRSTLILPTGQYAPGAEPLPFGVRGTLAVTVPVPVAEDFVFVKRRRASGVRYNETKAISAQTTFVRWGDWVGWGSLAALVAVLAGGVVFRRPEQDLI